MENQGQTSTEKTEKPNLSTENQVSTEKPLTETKVSSELGFFVKQVKNRKYTVRYHRTRVFFPHEWMAFFDKLPSSRGKITFHCLINTGARINEMRHVKFSDVDFKNKRMVLRVTKVRAREGEKHPIPRIIPISTEFRRYLENLREERKLSYDDYIPILSTPAANIEMKKALQEAGIKDWQMFSVHNVRKTFETWLIALGVPLATIVTHQGHKTTTAIKEYISPGAFSYEEKRKIRAIIGDLYKDISAL
jgi:integrase